MQPARIVHSRGSPPTSPSTAVNRARPIGDEIKPRARTSSRSRATSSRNAAPSSTLHGTRRSTAKEPNHGSVRLRTP